MWTGMPVRIASHWTERDMRNVKRRKKKMTVLQYGCVSNVATGYFLLPHYTHPKVKICITNLISPVLSLTVIWLKCNLIKCVSYFLCSILQGCGRDSKEQHALKHYETPRTEPHCLVLSLDNWSVW